MKDWKIALIPLVVIILLFASRIPQRTVALAYAVHGSNLMHSGNTAEAVSEFQHAVQLDPNNAMYHNNLGWELYKRGNFRQALPECQTAVRLNPASANAWDSLGAVLNGLGRYGEATEACGKAVQMKPTAIHRVTLGYALYRNGRKQEGREQWREAAADMNDPASAALANAYLQQYPASE